MPVTRIKYFTDDVLSLISDDNRAKYERYYQSCTTRCRDVKDTTYRTYSNFFNHFMAYLAVYHGNVGLYSDEYFENAVDIMESYMAFCQDTLKNHKKVINTKISAVSTFYNWSLKRGLIDRHPFSQKLERLKGSGEEKIINSYFLTPEQTQKIISKLNSDDKYDIQDQIIFSLMYDSANRIGAISKLTLSSLDMGDMVFNDVREKRGYMVQVMFMSRTKELIEEWLESRKDMDGLSVDALFIAKHNGIYNPMSKSTIQVRINKIGEIIGLTDFHAHCIRKSRLSAVYDDTKDLALTAELGNHKSTETTRSYYIRPKKQDGIKRQANAIRQIITRRAAMSESIIIAIITVCGTALSAFFENIIDNK